MTARTSHWFTYFFAAVATLFATGRMVADEPKPMATHAPAVIELQDQFEMPQRMVFPTTNITILTIADKKASEQVDPWVNALVGRYNGKVDLRGMADTSSMPGFLHGLVRHEIRKTRKYPVMLDWSGKVCAELDFKPGVPNVLVLDRDGSILRRVTGAAVDTNCTAVFETVDQALHKPVTLGANR